jgi:hypothetical protein
LVLHGVDKIGQRAARRAGKQFERAMKRFAGARRHRDALQRDERFEPLLRPQPFRRRVDLRERRERRPGVSADVVVRTAARGAENKERVALVKREDLRARIAEVLRKQERQQRRLPASRRPDDQTMADVADVKVQTKRRVAPVVAAYASGGLSGG